MLFRFIKKIQCSHKETQSYMSVTCTSTTENYTKDHQSLTETHNSADRAKTCVCAMLWHYCKHFALLWCIVVILECLKCFPCYDCNS